MRAIDDYFDDLDDVGIRRAPSRLQRMIDEQRRRVRRQKASRYGPGDEWDDEWDDDDYDDEYPDYNEDEFDSYSVTR